MNPFVAGQVHTAIEDIRLLEAFITAPLGLYSDIKMLLTYIRADKLKRAQKIAQHPYFKRFKPGTFLLQQCGPGVENYTETSKLTAFA